MHAGRKAIDGTSCKHAYLAAQSMRGNSGIRNRSSKPHPLWSTIVGEMSNGKKVNTQRTLVTAS
jgi:hypothetical protein